MTFLERFAPEYNYFRWHSHPNCSNFVEFILQNWRTNAQRELKMSIMREKERVHVCVCVCVWEREREREREKGWESRDLQPRLCEETIKYSNARDGTFCVNRRPPFPTPATFGAHVWRRGGFHNKTPKINSNLSLNKLKILAVHEWRHAILDYFLDPLLLPSLFVVQIRHKILAPSPDGRDVIKLVYLNCFIQ